MSGIYIASKSKHGPRWRALRAQGYPICSSWIDECEEGATSDWVDLWTRCVSEAAGADVLIVYAEWGEILTGALVEVGAALACGVRVFTVGLNGQNFTRHPRVDTTYGCMMSALTEACRYLETVQKARVTE